MRPVLFTWRGITVWSYPAMLYLGLVLGVVVGNGVANANHIDELRVYFATLVLIVPALAGARLLYVLAEWHHYRADLRQIWNRKDGGYIMYGGLPAALLVSLPLLRLLHVSIPAFWDTAIFTILVGMCFTRIGCLLNGCCSGRTTNSWFGINLPDRSGTLRKRIPTQALEAAWAAVLLIVAMLMRRHMPFPGALFLLICFAYACGRILMQFARENKTERRLSLAHAISGVILAFSGSLLLLYWRK